MERYFGKFLFSFNVTWKKKKSGKNVIFVKFIHTTFWPMRIKRKNPCVFDKTLTLDKCPYSLNIQVTWVWERKGLNVNDYDDLEFCWGRFRWYALSWRVAKLNAATDVVVPTVTGTFIENNHWPGKDRQIDGWFVQIHHESMARTVPDNQDCYIPK